ncbi:hypothetical protein ACFPM0_24120 [Pseudonocardia sulfidoxydans]|uniref:hypothetical protein n=1 Tax=Pseudonocardia sulfidoxydans TaxID=54011 RepID=UPI00360EBD2E
MSWGDRRRWDMGVTGGALVPQTVITTGRRRFGVRSYSQPMPSLSRSRCAA